MPEVRRKASRAGSGTVTGLSLRLTGREVTQTQTGQRRHGQTEGRGLLLERRNPSRVQKIRATREVCPKGSGLALVARLF